MKFITVHGTGDDIPDSADPKWWQPESDFSKDLLEKAGGGEIIPFMWDGKNDELSRRDAAEGLLWELIQYDEREEDVTLIGHSHGGSVISTALRLATSTERDFDHIKGVITVGTPFIRMKPQRWLWERLDFSGQLALLYSIFLTFLVVSSIITVVIFGVSMTDAGQMGEAAEMVQQRKGMDEYAVQVQQMESQIEAARNERTVALSTIASSLLFISLTWYLLLRSQRRIRALHSKEVARDFHDQFSPVWTALYDKRDEAINGLRRVYDLNLTLMQPTQSRGFLRLVVVLIVVFFLGSAVVADELLGAMEIARDYLPGWTFMTDPQVQNWLQWYAEESLAADVHWTLWYSIAEPLAFEIMLWYNINIAPNLTFLPDFVNATAYDDRGQPTFALSFLIDVISVLSKLLIVVAVFPLTDIINRLFFGNFLARRLNAAFGNQVKRQALGNTTKGEDVAGVGRVPQGWDDSHAVPMSEKASLALCEFAADHAKESLLNVQNVLADDTIHTDHNLIDELTEQLSWRELIHTSYFRVPESKEFIIHETLRRAGIRPTDMTRKSASNEATRLLQSAPPPAEPAYPVLRRPGDPQL
ncbi:MAG: hypothetical protein MRY59_10550 [Aquisalinus sp.]|nr:hypothetical protein [Aquisalinus sp.]